MNRVEYRLVQVPVPKDGSSTKAIDIRYDEAIVSEELMYAGGEEGSPFAYDTRIVEVLLRSTSYEVQIAAEAAEPMPDDHPMRGEFK